MKLFYEYITLHQRIVAAMKVLHRISKYNFDIELVQ